MSEEFADGEGRTLGGLDARQLAIVLHEVKEGVAATVDNGESFSPLPPPPTGGGSCAVMFRKGGLPQLGEVGGGHP